MINLTGIINRQKIRLRHSWPSGIAEVESGSNYSANLKRQTTRLFNAIAESPCVFNVPTANPYPILLASSFKSVTTTLPGISFCSYAQAIVLRSSQTIWPEGANKPEYLESPMGCDATHEDHPPGPHVLFEYLRKIGYASPIPRLQTVLWWSLCVEVILGRNPPHIQLFHSVYQGSSHAPGCYLMAQYK